MSQDAVTPGYRIRRASVADAAVIAHHRVAMFCDMGWTGGDAAALTKESDAYLRQALPSEEYRGWLVERRGDVVAGGGLLLHRLLPRPEHPRGGEAYILNVYTEPAHRRRGLARRLMDTMLAWCTARGVLRVSLHASDAGRRLYETLAFVGTNEMRRDAKPDEVRQPPNVLDS